ncbi:MAG: TatD family hydrolase [Chitinispirillia bacterium]|jgi:TatD DNase family protein
MWIDIHAHLYDKSDNELTECLENAIDANVSLVINAATSIETAQIVVSQCRKSKLLYGVVGISPFDVKNLNDFWMPELHTLLTNDFIIGVGEIGLDDSNPIYPSMEKQIPILEQQLEIASNLNLPVVIHSRGAEFRVLDLCKNQRITKAIFHCFTGSEDALLKIIDSGYYVSYSGIITFKNSDIEYAAKNTPLDRIFIETDSPYLSPNPKRGKRNEPANVVFVGQKIAEIKKISCEKLMKNLQRNFSKIFNLHLSN